MKVLTDNYEKTVKLDDIVKAVYNNDNFYKYDESCIRTSICRLRKKLGGKLNIINIYGFKGYMLTRKKELPIDDENYKIL